MSYQIKRAGVIGAGIMGAAIAAHLANVGIPSLLLDIPGQLTDKEKAAGIDPKIREVRDRIAQGGLDRALKASPAAFYSKRSARLISIGNTEDDIGQLAECDWIIEAVVERLDIKRDLYARLEKVRGEHAIISSNTSGISLHAMIEGCSPEFRRHFLITHFFNPVRYMKLLELVAGPDTDPDMFAFMRNFGSDVLGKGIVIGKDTPNFVGNRIGVLASASVFKHMLEDGYKIEEVDAIMGPVSGRPKSAVFRLGDIVGLDTLAHTAETQYAGAPNDEQHEVFTMPAFVQQMLAQGWLGDKTGQGFYKKTKVNGKTEILALDPETMEYSPQEKVEITSLTHARDIADPGERIRYIVNSHDRAGTFAWKVVAETLIYSANRIPEITDEIIAIDDAMRWGYNWDLGPFETWDALGVKETAERMQREGYQVPALVTQVLTEGKGSFYSTAEQGRRSYFDPNTNTYKRDERQAKVIQIAPLLKNQANVVKSNKGASLLDLGTGVLGLTFHTKMNAIDEDITKLLYIAVEEAEKNWKGIVIANDAADFSVGANLAVLLMASKMKQWKQIEKSVKSFQEANLALKYSRTPVVAAPTGRTLGGGTEIYLHAARVRASAELYTGLVEVGAGLIPSGGGTKELLLRLRERKAMGRGIFPPVAAAFQAIGTAQVSTSAEEARELGFLRKEDKISLDRERQIFEARQDVLELAPNYQPPTPPTFQLPGPGGCLVIEQQIEGMRLTAKISEHDEIVGKKLAYVLTGGDCNPSEPVTEGRMLELEREAFLSLCGMPKTQERMEALLKTGKPLRN